MPDEIIPPSHNWLIHASQTIRERYAKAQVATMESLETLVSVGELLNDVKETLQGTGRGAFGKWCDEQGFAFDKSWRARLMKLATNWGEIKAAVEALPEKDRDWTVKGALKVWGATIRAAKSGPETTSEDGEGTTEPKKKKETEAEKLRKDLAAALERITALEGELETLRKRPPAGASKAAPKAAEQHTTAAQQQRAMNNMAIVYEDRFKKLWPLYKGADTEGEREAAEGRLHDIAEKLGKSFAEVALECGLS